MVGICLIWCHCRPSLGPERCVEAAWLPRMYLGIGFGFEAASGEDQRLGTPVLAKTRCAGLVG